MNQWKKEMAARLGTMHDGVLRHKPPPSHYLLAVAVLVAGSLLAFWLLKTGPKAKPRPPAPSAVLVEVRPVHFGPAVPMVEALGTVSAARNVELRAQVAGEVVRLSPRLLPGGLFKKGEELLAIDRADYELAVRQLAGEVAEAEAALKFEQGNQEIARREYEVLGEELAGESLDLVLRKPQLATAQAKMETARARLARARLDLERTVVRAPFDGVVRSREVNTGSRVAANGLLLTLIGTKQYWVEVVLPVSLLRWIKIPRKDGEEGAAARIYDQPAWGAGVFRQGRVLRLAADLEEQGRMARLIVAVDDPLGLKMPVKERHPLFVGSYVRVEIEAEPLESVVRVERTLLRDGDKVWLMDADNRLLIRDVEVAFRGRDHVLVAGGLEPGERLVVTDLPAPVAGMALRTGDQEGPGKESGQ